MNPLRTFERTIKQQLLDQFQGDENKVVILYGPRQVGKTTLAREVLASLAGKKILTLNGDELPVQKDPSRYTAWFTDLCHGFLFIRSGQ